MEGPIYFASTHGVYNKIMDCTQTSWNPERTAIRTTKPCVATFIVPENTYVIEVGLVGYSTFATIDKYIWALVQGANRDFFMSYLNGKAVPGIFTEKKMKELLQVIRVYSPTDEVAVRELLLYSGFDKNKPEYDPNFLGNKGRLERHVFRNMGFYKFSSDPKENFPNPDDAIHSHPKRYPETPLTSFVSNKGGRILEDLRQEMLKGATTTNRDFINTVREFSREPSIFVFSSCGTFEFEQGTREAKAVFEIIQRLQNAHTPRLGKEPLVERERDPLPTRKLRSRSRSRRRSRSRATRRKT